jgi:hypothetical protein
MPAHVTPENKGDGREVTNRLRSRARATPLGAVSGAKPVPDPYP